MPDAPTLPGRSDTQGLGVGVKLLQIL